MMNTEQKARAMYKGLEQLRKEVDDGSLSGARQNTAINNYISHASPESLARFYDIVKGA